MCTSRTTETTFNSELQNGLRIKSEYRPVGRWGLRTISRIILGQWESESNVKFVPSGKWVRVWVGLDSTVQDGELKRLAEEGRLGILEMPAEISGVPLKIRIHL